MFKIAAGKIRIRYPYLLLLSLYIFAFYFFYIKYVPLIPPFQYGLLPVLFAVAVLTAVDLESGSLCFIFFFPLINSLPYVFGIHEDIPHAPTALVLFLAFILGVLLRIAFFKERFDLHLPVFRPMILFMSLVLISGIITIFRYSNFYPFWSDSIRELTTNTYGVSAGGAIMSVLFSSLNYITGFIFFFLVMNLLHSKKSAGRVLFTLGISVFLSIGFGLFQQMNGTDLGKNLLNTEMGVVNGTFKDSISFGTFLSMIIPLFLGAVFAFKGAKRIVSVIGFIAAFYLLFFTGSKIALVSAFISPLFFVLFFLHPFRHKKIISISFFVLVMVIASFSVLSRYGTLSKSVSTTRIQAMLGKGALEFLSSSRGLQWKSALAMGMDYPVAGVGVGAYIIELPNYADRYSRKTPDSAENYFLQVVSEMGLIGLILALWLFGMIAFLTLKHFFKKPGPGNDIFLQAGLVLAIGTYYVHIFFHTYIGSYEIKYFFWLLAALAIFGIHQKRNQERKNKKRSVFSRKNFVLISALTLIFFAGTLLWHSTHSLSLESRTKKWNLKHDFGFYPVERTSAGLEFRWSKKAAGLSLKVDKSVLVLSLHASHPDIDSRPVQAKIYLVQDLFREKRLLGVVTLNDSGWKEVSYDVTDELNEDILLFIEVDRVWNPHKALGTDDDRDIGVALSQVHFTSAHQQIP